MDDLAHDYFLGYCRLVTDFMLAGDAAAEKRAAIEAEIERLQAEAAAFATEERLARQNAMEALLETPTRRRGSGGLISKPL